MRHSAGVQAFGKDDGQEVVVEDKTVRTPKNVAYNTKKNGREEKIRSGKEMMFEYAKILIDKYTVKSRQIFLLDTYLVGIKYIRNFNIKMKYANVLDLFREFNGASLNLVAVYNENKERVGYLPKEQSEIIARLIDSGKKMIAIPIPFDGEVALKIYLVD